MGIVKLLSTVPDYILPNQSSKHYASVVNELKNELNEWVLDTHSQYDIYTQCTTLTDLSNRYFSEFVRGDIDDRYRTTIRNILVLLVNCWSKGFRMLGYNVGENNIIEPLYNKAILNFIREDELALFWNRLYKVYNNPEIDYPELEVKYLDNFKHLSDKQLERLFCLLGFITEVKLTDDLPIVPNYVIARLYQIKQIMVKLYNDEDKSVTMFPTTFRIDSPNLNRSLEVTYDRVRFVRNREIREDGPVVPAFLAENTTDRKLKVTTKPKKQVTIIVKKSRLVKSEELK